MLRIKCDEFIQDLLDYGGRYFWHKMNNHIKYLLSIQLEFLGLKQSCNNLILEGGLLAWSELLNYFENRFTALVFRSFQKFYNFRNIRGFFFKLLEYYFENKSWIVHESLFLILL